MILCFSLWLKRYLYGRRMILQNLQIRKIGFIIPLVPCQQSVTVQLGKSADNKICKNVLPECNTAVTMRAFQCDGLSTGRTNEPTPFEIFTPFSTCKGVMFHTAHVCCNIHFRQKKSRINPVSQKNGKKLAIYHTADNQFIMIPAVTCKPGDTFRVLVQE
mgnify:CR=1 FL=1